jgi:hypothetical protein
LLNDFLGLLLGAHEQQRAASCDGVDDEVVGLVKQAHGVLQVDDVDAVASPEDIGLHLRVPALGLVAEVNASLEQLSHGDRCLGGALRRLRGV